MDLAMHHVPEDTLTECAMRWFPVYWSWRLEEHLAASAECRDRLAHEVEIAQSIRAAGAKLGIRKQAARPRRKGLR